MIHATGDLASTIAITSVYYFIAARIVLGAGEAGNFPAAVKVTAEYFPKRDRAYSTSIFNAGSTIGALIAPICIPTLARYFKSIGIGGMAGGIGSFLINMGSGLLFDYADKSQMVFMGFQGKEAGYFIIFCICAVAYLLAWCVMKALVPKYKLIEV